MYAVISAGGKQQRVQKGDIIYVEKLPAAVDDIVHFDVMMLAKDGETAVIGTPLIKGASAVGKVVGQIKSAKIVVYKYKAKKNERKKQGHRQPYTRVEITDIQG